MRRLCSVSSGSTASTRISTTSIVDIIERLKRGHLRDITQNNYYAIWKIFGNFYQCLDDKPVLWEDRLLLFVGHLIDTGHKSQTIKSYVSAIKSTLWEDNIVVNEDRVLIASLTRACKLKNDVVHR